MYILTFDIEEWFHLLDHPSTRSEKQWTKFESRIEKNLDRILDILKKTNTKATFFCLGWIAKKYPNLIKKISSNNFEIACHSYHHQLAYEQTRQEFEEDLLSAKSIIENISCTRVDTYRAPGFSLVKNNLWILEILSKHGFKVDCSIFPANRGHGGLPSFKKEGPTNILLQGGKSLKELPLNTCKILGKKMVFSGGGYFRLIPYPILRKMFQKSNYVMTYFHPRDFDIGQPVIEDLNILRKFKSYYGLSSSQIKLEKLLKEFSFVDVQTAVKCINWEKVSKFSLNNLG